MSKKHILLVDDEKSIRKVIGLLIESDGKSAITAENGKEALDYINNRKIDVILQDIMLPDSNGIDLLQEYKKIKPEIPVIMMTALDDWENTVKAMKSGAYDYIVKPVDNRDLLFCINRALQSAEIALESVNPEAEKFINRILGHSGELIELQNTIRKVAPTNTTVLITGESGTGKELVANALHYLSPRISNNLIKVNCGAFSETLLESELFGYEKGAFTGANADKMGLLEVADKGTILLDEIGDISLKFQAKLLRVFQEREFKPVGSVKTKKIDVRFICSTNKDLQTEVEQGRFREDLYYRLNVVNLHIQPLRQRKNDIPLLASHFIAKFAHKHNKKVNSFSNEAIKNILNSEWKGNIRELENAVERAVSLCESDIIHIFDMFPDKESSKKIFLDNIIIPGEGINLEEELETIEKQYILKALHKCGGHMTNAAAMLNMSFRSFRYKVKKYKLNQSEKE